MTGNGGYGRWRVEQVQLVRIGLIGYGTSGRFFRAPLITGAVS